MQLVMAILAVVIGLAFAFGGWRFFLLLLPMWGFVVGFRLGTEAMRALFGDGTFATVTSWIVGFVIAVAFAILSYLYYYAAIAILAGHGRVCHRRARLGHHRQRAGRDRVRHRAGGRRRVRDRRPGAERVRATSSSSSPGLGGAATVIAGWFLLIGKVPTDNVTWWEVGKLISDSWFYLIVWGLLAAAGIVAQMRAPAIGPDTYELDSTSYRYS